MSISAYLAILTTSLVRAPSFQPSTFIWTTFGNETGWSNNRLVFLMGLLSPNCMYAGIDGVVHLAEESINASTAVPRALICTLLTGFVTTLTFSVALFYSGQDYEDIIATKTLYPIYEIMREACRSDTAAITFMVVFLLLGIASVLGCTQGRIRSHL